MRAFRSCWAASLSLLLAVAILSPTTALADEVNWSAWELLPVYHNGRIMPLNTFAAGAVEIISGREEPTLRLKGAVSETELGSTELAGARSLFPGDEPRKFEATELLLSWIVEPEKWEHVPFLIAEHDELRSEVLDVPVTNEAGEHLKYVSPAEVAASAGFAERLDEMRRKRDEAAAKQQEFGFSGVDAKADELYRAYTVFRQFQELNRGSVLDAAARRQITGPLETLARNWQRLQPNLVFFQELGEENELAQSVRQASESLTSMGDLYQQQDASLADFEAQVVAFRAAAQALSRATREISRGIAEKPPADWPAERAAQLEKVMSDLAGETRQLAEQADALAASLYENDQWLRVVPALNAKALDRDRDTEDESKPWLDLRTLVYGSPTAVAGYPPEQVAAVRSAMERVVSVYPEREKRPNDMSQALVDLSDSLSALGVAIEPLRDELPIANRDDDMIRYTAYPPAGFTNTEVRYAKQNPFAYSWMISLLATCCFVVYLIGLRWPWLFWTGVAILIVGLGWASYGFAMRIMITGWAPVTNMYETVVYVPFVVSLLGLWFLLLPFTWEGLRMAWRLTALPGTWEARSLTEHELAIIPAGGWTIANAFLGVPRLLVATLVFFVLCVRQYSAGNQTILSLFPRVDVGRTFPDGNDFMVWFTGICMLATAVYLVPRLLLAVLPSLYFIFETRRRWGVASVAPQVYARWPFALAATSVAFLGACVAWFAEIPGEEIEPLQPVLRDNFWLLIHVLTIVASYAAGALAWGLGMIALGYYLLGRYREPLGGGSSHLAAGHRPAGEVETRILPRRPPIETEALAGYVYKAVQVAVVLLAAGTILGALWADVAWGRFWGWDPKEVWALISFLVYLAILHGRYAGLFGNFGLVVGSTLGATAIIMSWYGVNFVLGVGLHSYGFGTGGQLEVFIGVLVNWALVMAASIRYIIETKASGMATPGDGEVDGERDPQLASSAHVD